MIFLVYLFNYFKCTNICLKEYQSLFHYYFVCNIPDYGLDIYYILEHYVCNSFAVYLDFVYLRLFIQFDTVVTS